MCCLNYGKSFNKGFLPNMVYSWIAIAIIGLKISAPVKYLKWTIILIGKEKWKKKSFETLKGGLISR